MEDRFAKPKEYYKSRKNASYLCNWCEYCTCRKGHKCSQYKRQVKKLKNIDKNYIDVLIYNNEDIYF